MSSFRMTKRPLTRFHWCTGLAALLCVMTGFGIAQDDSGRHKRFPQDTNELSERSIDASGEGRERDIQTEEDDTDTDTVDGQGQGTSDTHSRETRRLDESQAQPEIATGDKASADQVAGSETAQMPKRPRKTAGRSAREAAPAAKLAPKIPISDLATAPLEQEPPTPERLNPYPALPSLSDLYHQVPNERETLKRFGMDVFQNGTGNPEKLPMDLPAGPDYVLGAGDGVSINIRGSVPRTIMKIVDREGRIALPESGSVVVAGQTIPAAQEILQKALGSQFRDVKVDVSLTRLRTIRVYVVGDVKRPGAYDISSLSTPLNALYSAGGPTGRGSLRAVRLYRGEELVREVDLYSLLLRGVRSDIARLQSGDTVLVPPAGPQVAVAGMVKRPAIYELASETKLTDVLQLAGGVLVTANLHQVSVERVEAHQRRVLLKVDLPPQADNETLSAALGEFDVKDGDYVWFSPILPYSDQTVYLTGHVFRPGKYPYRPGMRIGELIRSYQDLLPEPAERAQIIRLMPPDYHPEAIEFRLSEVLTGDDPIDLQPFDTIRIVGRYEADPPNVYVYGEVLRPGKYPLAQGMTAAGLVRMAGGLTRSALHKEADIASYVVHDNSDVVTKHSTVEIGKALDGAEETDVVLKPNDVLTIRRLTGWDEIGASVTVSGNVLYPGTYGIEEGEKLSALLQRAGGFRENAYPEGAVLERRQVRELADKSRAQLIARLEAAGATTNFMGRDGQDPAQTEARVQQQQQALAALRGQPATGRLVIKISQDIGRWQATADDIELRPGDAITIPRRPSFVLVNGQVYNPAALTYLPGKSAAWYLSQAGGPTSLANKKDIYVIRANGSVLAHGTGQSWWKRNVLSASMRPGDTVVVPEKLLGGSHAWKNLLDTAQLASSLAIAARVATSF